MFRNETCVVTVRAKVEIVIINIINDVYSFEIFLLTFVVSQVSMIINFPIHWYVHMSLKQIEFITRKEFFFSSEITTSLMESSYAHRQRSSEDKTGRYPVIKSILKSLLRDIFRFFLKQITNGLKRRC